MERPEPDGLAQELFQRINQLCAQRGRIADIEGDGRAKASGNNEVFNVTLSSHIETAGDEKTVWNVALLQMTQDRSGISAYKIGQDGQVLYGSVRQPDTFRLLDMENDNDRELLTSLKSVLDRTDWRNYPGV